MTSKASKGSSTVLFYFLLSWLFTAYYVVAISRGSSLSDLEVACTQTSPYVPVIRPLFHSDISELLFKHINNMNACDVVKLRGVTSNTNDSLKKAQKSSWSTNSYCVVMIILSVVCLVQVLRSLARLIHDKLLRAGDVETNPGPTPPSSPTPPTPDPPASPLDHTAEPPSPSGASSPNLPVMSIETIGSGMPPSISAATPNGAGDIHDGLSLPQGQTKAHTPTLSGDTKNTGAPDMLVLPHMHNQKHFITQMDPTLNGTGDSTIYQQPNVESHIKTGNSPALVTGKDYPIVKANKSHVHGKLHRTGSSMNLKEYTIFHGNAILCESLNILKRSHSSSDIPNNEDSPTLPAVNFEQYMKSHTKKVSEAVPVQIRRRPTSDLPRVKTNDIAFFTHVNKLLRINVDCKYCPMCSKEKLEVIKSHIFPRSMLVIFNEIHCLNESEDFIYDFSRDKKKRARAIAYPMLCRECEDLCDEESLKILYIFLMDKPNMKCIKVLNDGSWLQHVLANIMFRGILLSDSLPEDLLDKYFWQSFTTLQDYCRDTKKRMPWLNLFLLPNKAMNEEEIAFLYPLEYVLRNPSFSTVVRSRHKKTQINFIYTKFDCFHLVLPLDDDSKAYFDRFQNGFDTFAERGHNYVYLRWTEQCIPDKVIDRKTYAVQYSFTEEAKTHLFPEILLNVNFLECKRFMSMIYANSRLTHDCTVMMDYLPGLNHEYPTKYFEGDAVPTQDKPQISQEFINESVTFSKRLTKEELTKMIKNASKYSPHRLRERKLDELREEIRKKNDELNQVKKLNQDYKKYLRQANADIDNEKKLCLDEITRQEFEYERQLGDYKKKCDKVQQLLNTERRELKAYKHACEKNKKHIEQSEMVQKNLYAALEQMSAELREFSEHTKSCVDLHDKLLQRCINMKEMISSNIDVHKQMMHNVIDLV